MITLLSLWFATLGAVPAPDTGCAALSRMVESRVAADAVVTACVVDTTVPPAFWDEALPDTAARIGRPSWFTLRRGTTVRRVRATLHVAASHLRTERTLRRGDTATRADLTVVNGALEGATFTRLASPALGSELRVQRLLGVDVVVAATDVAPPPLVTAGQAVVAVARIGAVEVTAAARAIEAGALGDAIRVSMADRRRVLHGRVVGPGRVEVIHER